VSLRIGIDLGGTKIEGIVLDGSGEAARLRIETPRDDYEGTLAAVGSLIVGLEKLVSDGSRISDPGSRPTIGIGIPGTVSPSTGLVKNANSTWLIGKPLQKDLERLLGQRVRIANDANCFAVSEATDGAGAGAEVVFGVIAGTGVGGGVTMKGRIISGANGISGEWGHNPLPWADAEDEGRLCYCGKRGCIETFLSGPGLTADHERVTGDRLLPPQIIEAASGGDSAAEQSLRRYERRMARALASVINILDPDVIVLGGGMSNIGRLYANIPRLWDPFVFAAEVDLQHRDQSRIPNPESRLRTRLLAARHGATSGVRGAAWLWPDDGDGGDGPIR
jgi:fructokinase